MQNTFDVVIVPGSVREVERELRAIAAGFSLSKKQTNNLILAGGFTSKQSEASSMLKIILKEFPKLNKNHIYLEENSMDTSANFKNSLKIINANKWEKIGIIANTYHLPRALKLADSYGINVEGISVEELLIEYKPKYAKIIKEDYKTNDMKNIFVYEHLLYFLLKFDKKGRIPNTLSNGYYKFINK